ncbi:MAG: FecR domain-containing protein [Cyclobacteriaceae bacterium]|nr:FecR domain-containing protein [Cyclobacteriaceae bacterium SS2]
MESSFNISDLIVKSHKGELTATEQQTLTTWLEKNSLNRDLFEKLTNNRALVDRIDLYQKFNAEKSFSKIDKHLAEKKVVPFKPVRLLKYAATLLLPLLASAAIVYYFMLSNEDAISSIDEQVHPGVQKATLTLADGGTVELQESEAFQEVKQGTSTIKNEYSGLIYASSDDISEAQAMIFNILTTPYGGRYSVRLSDGTRVTLNAGSSLKYPVSFSDSTRTVYLQGEAYFEVTHNGKPFIVSNEQQNIRVLGTSFNVSAYANEPAVLTTLVEGKVQIEAPGGKAVLAPGEQSKLLGNQLTVEKVNTSQYTSWINGKFEFNRDNMDIVIKRLSRWYDFNYEFENKDAVNYHFTGRLDSDQPISSILQMLEATSNIRFETNGKTIVVK